MDDKKLPDGKKPTSDILTTKVAEWLQEEGYPLEYTTAATFHRYGFGIWQGSHVRLSADENPREIDVIAVCDYEGRDPLIRIEYVVECKWSRSNPWVVFTSPFRHMSSAACISQTIGSEFGRSALWLQAGDRRLAQLKTFATPRVPGFGGRQAFSKQKDTFYSAVQAVVSAATSLMVEYDQFQLTGAALPGAAVIAFPVVVVDGDLFEAYPTDGGRIELRQVVSSRIHWQGAAAWNHHSTVDIVTTEGLAQYAEERASEADTILSVLKAAVSQITNFARSGRRSELRITLGSRGILGTPKLIARLIRAHKK